MLWTASVNSKHFLYIVLDICGQNSRFSAIFHLKYDVCYKLVKLCNIIKNNVIWGKNSVDTQNLTPLPNLLKIITFLKSADFEKIEDFPMIFFNVRAQVGDRGGLTW